MPPSPRFLPERSIEVGARSLSAKVERFGFDCGGVAGALIGAGGTGAVLIAFGFFVACFAGCVTGLGTGVTTTLLPEPPDPLFFAAPLAVAPATPPAGLGVGARVGAGALVGAGFTVGGATFGGVTLGGGVSGGGGGGGGSGSGSGSGTGSGAGCGCGWSVCPLLSRWSLPPPWWKPSPCEGWGGDA